MSDDSYYEKFQAQDAAETQSLIAEIVAGMPEDAPGGDVSEASPEAPVVVDPAARTGIGEPEAPEPESLPVEASAPPAPAPPKVDEPDPRALIRVLEREGQVRDRESAIERRERAVQEAEARAKAAKGVDPSALLQRLMEDPMAVLEEVGADPAHVARLVTAGVLGDKAPPELKASTELARFKAQQARELASLKNELRARDHEAERTRVRDSVRAHVTRKNEGESKHPTVDSVAADDPDYVTQAVFDTIARDARERAGTDRDDGRPMSVEDAVARVEAEWSRIARRKTAPASPATQTAVTETAPKTAGTAPPPIPKNPRAPSAPRKVPYYREPEAEDEDAMAHALAVLVGRAPA